DRLGRRDGVGLSLVASWAWGLVVVNMTAGEAGPGCRWALCARRVKLLIQPLRSCCRRAALLTVLVAASLASPAAASAHLRSVTAGGDYRARGRRADTAAYSAQIYQSDHGLALTVKPGHVVAMLGYLGEPVFRLDRAGLWVNEASPTAVAVRLLEKSQA